MFNMCCEIIYYDIIEGEVFSVRPLLLFLSNFPILNGNVPQGNIRKNACELKEFLGISDVMVLSGLHLG